MKKIKECKIELKQKQEEVLDLVKDQNECYQILKRTQTDLRDFKIFVFLYPKFTFFIGWTVFLFLVGVCPVESSLRVMIMSMCLLYVFIILCTATYDEKIELFCLDRFEENYVNSILEKQFLKRETYKILHISNHEKKGLFWNVKTGKEQVFFFTKGFDEEEKNVDVVTCFFLYDGKLYETTFILGHGGESEI